MKSKKKAGFIILTIIITLIIISFMLYLNFNKLSLQNLFTFKATQTNCLDMHPEETTDFYIDPQGICAPCSDEYSGTIGRPWCTLERAFNLSNPSHFKGRTKLYLREGIYRFDSTKLTIPPNGYLNGIAEQPTLFSSYPGEEVSLYGSESVPVWNKTLAKDGSVVWTFSWLDYLKKTQPQVMQHKSKYVHVPQALFIDNRTGDLSKVYVLRQANETKTKSPTIGILDPIMRVYKDYNTMPQGFIYYENNPISSDYGVIFMKLPEELIEKDPNILTIEVPLDTGLHFGIQNYTILNDFSIRFTNSIEPPYPGGLSISGMNNLIENLDSSYNVMAGLLGRCSNCIIKNSTINHNGNTGSVMNGNNIVYKESSFIGNGWRPFYRGWQAGGIKLIPSYFNYTIQENIFAHNNYTGLWLDYTGDAPDISKGIKAWENYTGAGHLIENNYFFDNYDADIVIEVTPGTKENPTIIRHNFIEGVNTGPWGDKDIGILISSSPFIEVYNNVLYNLNLGVAGATAYQLPPPLYYSDIKMRHRLTNINVSSNIFLNVSFPIQLLNEKYAHQTAEYQQIIVNNTIDNNVYYGTRKPTINFRQVTSYVNFSRDFVPYKRPEDNLIFDLYALDLDNNALNGRWPNIVVTEEIFNWYKKKTIEQMEEVIYFVESNPAWDNHPKYSITEWRNATGFDNASIIENPLITLVAGGGYFIKQDSPALKKGFSPSLFGKIEVLENITLPIPSIEGAAKKNRIINADKLKISSIFQPIRIFINGISNISDSFNKTATVTIQDSNNNSIIEFDYDFSQKDLDLAKLTIIKEIKENRTSILIRVIGEPLASSKTAHLFLEGNTAKDYALCILDRNIFSLNQMTADCIGEDEAYIKAPQDIGNEKAAKTRLSSGNELTVTRISNKQISIAGLAHSAISQKCAEEWTCSRWSLCQNLEKVQIRKCIDENECGTSLTKPEEIQDCYYSPVFSPQNSTIFYVSDYPIISDYLKNVSPGSIENIISAEKNPVIILDISKNNENTGKYRNSAQVLKIAPLIIALLIVIELIILTHWHKRKKHASLSVQQPFQYFANSG